VEKIRLGRTELMVTRSSFGALPIQRVTFEEAKFLLQKAYEGGINYFDTARSYTDSEEKIGYSLAHLREDIVISTKSHGKNGSELREHLESSLENMKTDYIDIYQFHNAKRVPRPGDETGLYDEALKARNEGKIRFIGLTSHTLDVALEAAASGLFDTIQFPLNHISSDRDLSLISLCKKHDVGVIAMKGLSGGLITDASVPFVFFRQFDNVVPIWGIQREWELDQFLAMEADPPELDGEMKEKIARDKRDLAGNFCRSCGYCMPCPAGIDIPQAARMAFLLRRSPFEKYMTPEWKEKMEKINDCMNCGQCSSRCPYGLDTPALLKTMLADYEEFYSNYQKQVR
jgi:predicted aldo/keto reductase-like oxidoreductase